MRPHVWALAIWASMFTHSLFTQLELPAWVRVAPLGILIGSLSILTAFTLQYVTRFYDLLLFNCWLGLSSLALILRTLSIVDDMALGAWIAVLTVMASVIWCIISKMYAVSESGWHWYVWSMTIVLTLCAASMSTPNDEPLLTLYAVTAAIVVLANVLYWRHICQEDAHNEERCILLWRTCAGCAGTTAFLLLAILYAMSDIDQQQWQQAILILEGCAFVVIIVDAFMPRLSHTPIYAGVDGLEDV